MIGKRQAADREVTGFSSPAFSVFPASRRRLGNGSRRSLSILRSPSSPVSYEQLARATKQLPLVLALPFIDGSTMHPSPVPTQECDGPPLTAQGDRVMESSRKIATADRCSSGASGCANRIATHPSLFVEPRWQ
nr:hypothetical protein Itr_chr01CG09740 [Ipomoea trifida]